MGAAKNYIFWTSPQMSQNNKIKFVSRRVSNRLQRLTSEVLGN